MDWTADDATSPARAQPADSSALGPPQLLPQSVLDHVSDAMVGTDVSGMVIRWNRAAEEIFGRATATVLGAHVSEAVGAQLDPAQIVSAGGVTHATCLAADGAPLLMRIAATYSRDGYFVVCVEEAAGRRGEQHFQTVLNFLDEGVVVFGVDGCVHTANRAAAQIWGSQFGADPGGFGNGKGLLALYDATGRLLERAEHPVLHTVDTGQPVIGRVVGFDRTVDERVWLWMNCRRLESGHSGGNEVLLSFIDITAEQTATARLVHRASHDPLTLLPNRARVLDRIGQALAHLGPLLAAVLFIDLDNLKDINDSRGHEAGDAVLQTVASRLRATARGHDVVARLGGDEFVYLVMGPTTTGDIDNIARRILHALCDPIQFGAISLTAGASIGVTLVIDGDTRNASQIVHDADLAMYEAKRRGRNQIHYFA